jgi:hypothetical protein
MGKCFASKNVFDVWLVGKISDRKQQVTFNGGQKQHATYGNFQQILMVGSYDL